jgi:nucleoside-diphosphate-sugar epimerase
MPSDDALVLVTGATGFLAKHCIAQLLDGGYRVRGTLRDLRKAEGLRSLLGGGDRLTFAQADLGDDRGWPEAVAGCTYVLHVASPVPSTLPAHADEVIVPAREGTLRVLRAAVAARVERVVLTSSTAAVLYGHPRDGTRTYDENDWSLLNDAVGPYERSKTIAERAAWDYVASLRGTMPDGRRPELVALQPGALLGPVLDADFSVSAEIVRKLMNRDLPGCPDLGWALADVRDVAGAHITAMTHPRAPGQRFILAGEHMPMRDIAGILARHFGPRGYKVPSRRLPSWLLRLVATWDKTMAMTVRELGRRQDVSSARAREVLGWRPRGEEAMVVDMAESLIRCGAVAAER